MISKAVVSRSSCSFHSFYFKKRKLIQCHFMPYNCWKSTHESGYQVKKKLYGDHPESVLGYPGQQSLNERFSFFLVFVLNFKRQGKPFKHLRSCSDTSLLCQSAWPTLPGFPYLNAELFSSNVEFSNHKPLLMFLLKKPAGLGGWILKMHICPVTDLLILGLKKCTESYC